MQTSTFLPQYNVPAPRYTSYPTVPFWEETPPTQQQWKAVLQQVIQTDASGEGISLYIHLPYCESLCTYCGCNTRITVNHAVERPYIETLLAEWKLYLAQFPGKPLLREIHLGGGTPTFFQPANLRWLLSEILRSVNVPQEYAFSLEGHPGNTTREHLQELYDLGFRRVSYGIQDFDLEVQKTINRVQTVEQVREITAISREIGYESINYDLIYGLPKQTPETIQATMQELATLRPERVAFYSYAHVPWLRPGQRSYSTEDLPQGAEKRALFDLGTQKLLAMGYKEVGMDHFALPGDELLTAANEKHLHRNFMGYTPRHTRLSIGLGASAISDTFTGFTQNYKKVEDYRKAVEKGEFPFFKGHILTADDVCVRTIIGQLMCNYEAPLTCDQMNHPLVLSAKKRLSKEINAGWISFGEAGIWVSEAGKAYIRNICMAFDHRYHENIPQTPLFSSAV